MHFHQSANERQSHAHPSIAAVNSVIGLEEHVEDIV